MTSAAPATAPSARIELLTAPLPGKPMLTHVEIHWHEGAREDWFKFGKPVASRIVDRHVRSESYTPGQVFALVRWVRSEEHTSELQSLMRISYAVFCLKKTMTKTHHINTIS